MRKARDLYRAADSPAPGNRGRASANRTTPRHRAPGAGALADMRPSRLRRRRPLRKDRTPAVDPM